MAAIGAVALYRIQGAAVDVHLGRRRRRDHGVLPGDELVCANTPRTTRAVTIDAPIAAVWPWLAQIGEDRGGFYSYSLLERAVGAHIQNANTVHPEWQDVRVGDTVWLARRYGDAARQVVAAVEPRIAFGVDVARRLRAGAARQQSVGRLGLLSSAQETGGPGCWPAGAAAPSGTPASTYPISSWSRR